MTSAPAARRRKSWRPVRALQIERDAAFRGVVVPEREAALGVGDVVEEWPDAALASPPGGSILITSAPRSPSSLPQNWPFSSASSRTRRPASGPGKLSGDVSARSLEHLLHVVEARPLRRPERAVGEAGAELLAAAAEQAFDDLARVLTDQRAGQVIEGRGCREFERRVLHLVPARAPDAPSPDTCRGGAAAGRAPPGLRHSARAGRARRRPGSAPSARTSRASRVHASMSLSSSSWCCEASGERGETLVTRPTPARPSPGRAAAIPRPSGRRSRTSRCSRRDGCDRRCAARPSARGSC